ncbi:MAG: hypothetical protein ABSG57_14110 [Candidatus Bathyarchaeia archaeon]|jgi:hypothetical protein
MRTVYGFGVVVTGLVLVALVYVAAVVRWNTAADVTTVVGSVTGIIGTLVGVFFGNSVGSAGKDKAEAARNTAEKKLQTMTALAGKHAPLQEVQAALKG